MTPLRKQKKFRLQTNVCSLNFKEIAIFGELPPMMSCAS